MNPLGNYIMYINYITLNWNNQKVQPLALSPAFCCRRGAVWADCRWVLITQILEGIPVHAWGKTSSTSTWSQKTLSVWTPPGRSSRSLTLCWPANWVSGANSLYHHFIWSKASRFDWSYSVHSFTIPFNSRNAHLFPPVNECTYMFSLYI